MDVSEAEIMATHCGCNATRLSPAWEELLLRITRCGRLRVKTQNKFAEMESIGNFGSISLKNNELKSLDGFGNLKINLDNLESAYAFESILENGKYEYSIHIFGLDGSPIHKFFLSENNSQEIFQWISSQLKHENQSPVQIIKQNQKNPTRIIWNKTDHFCFIDTWNASKTNQDFSRLLKHFNITRAQALRLAEGEMTHRLGRFEFENLLKTVAKVQTPLTIQVGNAGGVHYFSGNIDRFMANDFSPSADGNYFKIRINRKGIADAWRVTMPTKDGKITSLELYDYNGGPIISFFNDMRRNKKDSPYWLKILNNLHIENLEYNMSQLGRKN